MPIIWKKNLDDDNPAVQSFLEDNDVLQIKPPPLKKRKLNYPKNNKKHSISGSSKSNKKKTKSFLKRQRIKKKKLKLINKNNLNSINNKKKLKLNKNNSSLFVLESQSTMKQSIEFQKIFLKYFKISINEFNFKFKSSNFIQISRSIDDGNGSLEFLLNFLRKYYFTSIDHDDSNNDNKKEWNAYTKSMQVIIISPSVRKAVDTVKSLKNIHVNHSFIHKKQLKKYDYNYEEYDEKDENDNKIAIQLRVCELFGKHRKIDYQQKELLNKSWHCGVGSVNRINKLCKSKYLNLKQCELIIIDMERNKKNMSILDMQQTCKDLCEWMKEFVFKTLKSGKTKIALL